MGAEICCRFAQASFDVAVLDRDYVSAQRAADLAGEKGGQATALAVDLTDFDAAKAAVERIESEYGPIDVLVNCAGWDSFMPFLASGPDFWEKIISLNLRTVLNITHPVLARMVTRRSGRVVSIASDAARVGSSGESVYSACKAGLIALSKTLAREHARDGITFNVVCPGVTQTQMLDNFLAAAEAPERLRAAYERSIPMGRLGMPEDVAGSVLFFGSDDAAFVTGQVLSVSGGLTMHG